MLTHRTAGTAEELSLRSDTSCITGTTRFWETRKLLALGFPSLRFATEGN